MASSKEIIKGQIEIDKKLLFKTNSFQVEENHIFP